MGASISKIVTVVFLAAGLAVSTGAQATVLDFESGTTSGTTFTQNGFNVTVNSGSWGYNVALQSSQNGGNSSQVLAFCSSNGGCDNGTYLTLASANSSLFSVTALDFANWSYGDTSTGTLTFIGHLLGGGTVIDTVSTSAAWASTTFADLSNLVSLDISASNIYAADIDNIQVTAGAVPEPGSLALLGLGFAGLSLVRRRKNA